MTTLDTERAAITRLIGEQRLALVRMSPEAAQYRLSRGLLAELLLDLVDALAALIEDDDAPELSPLEDELEAHMIEAESLLEGLRRTETGAPAEHRFLQVLASRCVLARGWLDGGPATAPRAIAHLEAAVESGPGAGSDVSGDYDGAWWTPEQADKARWSLVGMLGACAADTEEGLDRLIQHAEAAVNAPIPLTGPQTAERRAILGLALADRAKGEDFATVQKTAFRERAIQVLREALDCVDLDRSQDAVVRNTLAQALMVGHGDIEDVDLTLMEEVVELLAPVLCAEDDEERAMAYWYTTTMTSVVCGRNPTFANHDRVLTIFRRAVADPATEFADRISYRIELAGQLLERADGEWPGPPVGWSVPEPEQDSAEALSQLEDVLDSIRNELGSDSVDEETREAQLAALGSVVELMSRPRKDSLSSEALNRLIDRAEELTDLIDASDATRGEIYFHLGTALYERASRGLKPVLPDFITSVTMWRLGLIEEVSTLAQREPGLARDIERAVDLVRRGTSLSKPDHDFYFAMAAGLGSFLTISYIISIPFGDAAIIRESLRWMRIAIEVAPQGEESQLVAEAMRECLPMALAQHVFASAPFASGRGIPANAPDPSGLTSIESDIYVLEHYVEARLTAQQEVAPTYLLMAALLTIIQGPHRHQDAFALLQRVVDAAPGIEQDEIWALQCAKFLLAANTADTMSPDTILDINSLFTTGFGLDPIRQTPPDVPRVLLVRSGANATPAPVVPAEAAGTSGHLTDPAEPIDIDTDAAALIGDAGAYPFTETVGRVLEVAEALTAGPDRPGQAMVCSIVRALALHGRWLRERDPRDLAQAIEMTRHGRDDADGRQAIELRIEMLLAGLLQDRYALLGDRADLDAAHRGLSALLGQVADDPYFPSLPLLLAELCEIRDLPELKALFPESTETDPAGTRGYARAELLAALGEAETLLGQGRAYSDRAEQRFREAAELLPSEHPRYPAVLCSLGRIKAEHAARAGDWPTLAGTVDRVLDAAQSAAADNPYRPTLLLRAAALLAFQAGVLPTDDANSGATASLGRGIALLGEAADLPGTGFQGSRARLYYGFGRLLQIRFRQEHARGDLDLAVHSFAEARLSLESSPGSPFTAVLLTALAQAYREYGPQDTANCRRSRDMARQVLAVRRQSVQLQAGTRAGLEAARQAEPDTMRLARWCLADQEWTLAAEALDLGRGLVLHAATVASEVPVMLRGVGRTDLAVEWEQVVPQVGAEPAGTTGLDRRAARTDRAPVFLAVPDDLRRRVLEALAGNLAERRLLSAPTPAEIGDALRKVGADALVHLVAGTEDFPGYAVLVGEDGFVHGYELPGLRREPGGALEEYASALEEVHRETMPRRPFGAVSPEEQAAYEAGKERAEKADARWESALDRLCAWAGAAAMARVLGVVYSRTAGRRPRVVLAPAGPLGLVPWHAADCAGPGEPARPACQDAVVSYCATARQLVDTAARPLLPPDGIQAMVVDPKGSASMHRDARVIRAAFYPGSTVLGDLGWLTQRHGAWTGPEQVEATAENVLALLPGRGGSSASLFIANGHARALPEPAESHLMLQEKLGVAVTVEQVLANGYSRDWAAPGGLILLPNCSSDLTLDQHEEALTISTAFLAAGAATVVGARWPIDDDNRSTVLMYMFHHFLNGRREPRVPEAAGSPAHALRAAQLWMLDPDRAVPPGLRDQALARERPDKPFGSARVWASFTHHGH